MPHKEFNDIGPILEYHKNLVHGKNIHAEVAERKQKHQSDKQKIKKYIQSSSKVKKVHFNERDKQNSMIKK